ncbi:acyltransferase family protein [Leifsonia shinshuensis]|uniref:acyltransferase family protein n=1 Tax=Leifsonia shinshuensis TaxID=150026 RepID=UPI002866D9F3|nr:acyltransferase family protein [Leifsonia shinshuensis]MDR6971320.1 peptidoglycan/LPS O-acetylase OafA/YrhL [Leifsonia shinshuensis]
MRRYAAVDGLRGIAILSIAVYHTGLYSNGIFGVDAFLVLSGFFVTLTLGRDLVTEGRLGLRAFYGRRVKRLLPALLLVLVLTTGAVWMWASAAERAQFIPRALAALGNVANWQAIVQGDGYWEAAHRPGPLSHLWSLSLTEQFYLVWPPALAAIVFLARKAGAIQRMTALLIGGALALTLVAELTVWGAFVFAGEGADRAYLGTDTHGMALAAGAVAAVVVLWTENRIPHRDPPPARSPLLTSLLGMSLLTAIVVASICADSYRADWLYFGGFAAVAAALAALIVLLTSESPLASVLSVGPLVAVGRMSYALFLVHMPVIWFTRTILENLTDVEVLAVSLPVSLMIAATLHHAFSEPLRRATWDGRRRILAAGLTAATAVAVLGAAVLPPGGGGAVRVLTLGDSLANNFATALSHSSSEIAVSDGGIGGCGIMSPQATRMPGSGSLDVPTGCLPWEERYAARLAEDRPDVVLIDLAWDGVEQQLDGRWSDLTDKATQNHYRAQLSRLGGLLEGTSAHVLIANSRASTCVTSAESAAIHSRMIAEFAAAHRNFSLLDLNGHLCPGGDCATTTKGGAPLYVDGVHFTRAGLAELEPWLTHEVLRVAP